MKQQTVFTSLKLLIITAGRVLTPASGGELRTHHLARELAAQGHTVDVVALVTRNHPTGFERLGERLTLRQIHSVWLDLAAVADRVRAIPITELPLWLVPLRSWLRRLVARERYDIVQFDFPWFAGLYGAAAPARVVYNAQNIESQWWAPRLASYPGGRFWGERLLRHETAAATRAAAVAACSGDDLAWLERRVRGTGAEYSAERPALPSARPQFALVPNGYDASRFRRPDPETRQRLRRELGFPPGERIALFCGSHTHPNREAAELILNRIAPACGEGSVHFVIVGRVGETLGPRTSSSATPATASNAECGMRNAECGITPGARTSSSATPATHTNAESAIRNPQSIHSAFRIPHSAFITITGPVPDVVPYLQAADLGLNPMLSGSGSNIKVAEACAAGLPLITTPFGLRGFESLAPWVDVCEIEAFPAALAASAWPNKIPDPALAEFSWAASARRLAELYQAIA